MQTINPWTINNLKAIRHQNGYTQKQVAELLGKDIENRLSFWEAGKAVPSVLNLFKLCRLYKVTAEDVYPEILERSSLLNQRNYIIHK